ncbi:MAG: hypothetical protein Q8Q89_02095 [bacterium]|nr:hypothetical protein [bacterium]
MTFIGGAIFLLAIYYFYTPVVKNILDRLGITNFSLEIDLIILLISYVSGKLLVMLYDLLESVYYQLSAPLYDIIIIKKSFKSLISEYKVKCRSLESYFLPQSQYYSVSPRELESVTTIADRKAIPDKFPGVSAEIERNIFNFIFIRIVTAIIFLGVLFLTWKLIFLFIVVFYLSIQEHKALDDTNLEIFKAAVKESHKNKQ